MQVKQTRKKTMTLFVVCIFFFPLSTANCANTLYFLTVTAGRVEAVDEPAVFELHPQKNDKVRPRVQVWTLTEVFNQFNPDKYFLCKQISTWATVWHCCQPAS